jgi:hypothetical protein
MKKNIEKLETPSIMIVCKEIDTKYSHHKKLVIGSTYYTKIFSSTQVGCNVYRDNACKDFVGSYWCWMFYSVAQNRQEQIDRLFNI